MLYYLRWDLKVMVASSTFIIINTDKNMDEHQLDCMMKHIKYMSNSLGNPKTTKDIDMPKDDFQKARLTYQLLVKKYEENTRKLAEAHKIERIQKIELEEDLYDLKRQMQRELKYMINHSDMKEKELKKMTGKPKHNKEKVTKLSEEVNYKKLECVNCQKTYALLCGSGGQTKVKVVTLADLKLKQTMKEPLISDSQNQQNQDQQFLMERIKAIDELIQSQMDQILDKIELFKKHAISISDALDLTHKQIVLNLKVMTTNQQQLQTSNLKLKKILKHWTRPNCCLDVVLILLLLVLLYLIVRQFT